MAARLHGRTVAFSLWGAGVAFACVVPNVDLVDHLPGSGGDADVVGGDNSSGPDSGGSTGGRAGAATGGSSGGTTPTSGGTTPANGGTATVAGTGGTDGGIVWKFSGKYACDIAPPTSRLSFCDSFEATDTDSWGDSPQWTRPAIGDAPSGTRVMRTGFHGAPMNNSEEIAIGAANFNMSFWVRFSSKTDQTFISWTAGGLPFTFGLEGARFRFRLEQSPPVVAPELDKYTRAAVVDTWTCVEIEKTGSTFQATVTAFGEPPYELAPVGGTADADVDKILLDSIPGKTLSIDRAPWSLGDPGTDIEIDDVRVGHSLPSVCKDFIDANR